MTGEGIAADEQLRGVARSALGEYRVGRISLRKLIDELDLVWSRLERSEWSDEFRGHWWTLEQVYSVALDRGEIDSLSSEYLSAIGEATDALEGLLESRRKILCESEPSCR